MGKQLRLSDLRKGQRALVSGIAADDFTASKLRAIGFTDGTEVECRGSGIFSDPSAYLVKGVLIALRKKNADKIKCIRTESDAS
ncbi:MAG: ferrous iron transport protein A [Clostridia bacterium]|nr:ferrous iron transport protein A [Clostridia bacterium]